MLNVEVACASRDEAFDSFYLYSFRSPSWHITAAPFSQHTPNLLLVLLRVLIGLGKELLDEVGLIGARGVDRGSLLSEGLLGATGERQGCATKESAKDTHGKVVGANLASGDSVHLNHVGGG